MRALISTRLFHAADSQAALVRHVWQHELLPLYGMDDAWAFTGEGYIPAADVQPAAAPSPVQVKPDIGWVEVITPYATLHLWADDDAPLLTCIPVHGVLYAIDRLETRGGTWIAFSLPNENIGWGRAASWAATTFDHPVIGGWSLLADKTAEQVAVLDENHALICTIPAVISVSPGTYPIAERIPGGVVQDEHGTHHGVPALMKAGEARIFGITWHSTVHQAGALPLPAWAARWLFRRIDRLVVV
jgi:hypothetical protein